jgi:anti-sigma regulatory factor (Ser/Thr protein kinase)
MLAHSFFASVAAPSVDEHILRNQPPGTVTLADSSVNPASSPDGRRDAWRFPSVLVSVSEMRLGLRGFLHHTALSYDETEDLLLAASEAANNAVEHAQRPTEPFFDVSGDVDDGQVTIVIKDYGGWQQPTLPSDRGRGLAMMRILADTSVTTRSHGTTVTMRSRCTGPGAVAEEAQPS